jgi:hypothetical protein
VSAFATYNKGFALSIATSSFRFGSSISVSRRKNPVAASHFAINAFGSLPVTVRFLHRKCVRQMPHFADFPVFQQHLHDVETDFHRRIFQQSQIVERGLGKQPTFAGVHRSRRARPVFRRARFDLDERETVVLAKNQINLAARRTEIGREKYEALPLKKFFGRALAEFAAP